MKSAVCSLGLVENSDSSLAEVFVALAVSLYSFFLIFILDRLHDANRDCGETNKSTQEAIEVIIFSKGLLIGFAWERSFETAAQNITEHLSDPALKKLGLAIVLCGIVVPAY